ncbi:dihydroflavonol-4-reductase [Aquipluma nitroreducens]|uniref:Dihydroflavonol-4-reductase n=1 Tax=Aquipluma nitroreducens TaxID=2010828 RepID=A0A5K7SCA0_9BACT|nr:aldehyde reductase [Aquipluma nitroreducens]BBE19188.1 dihydroflavonol-4-reductase [Aquipluma nitroreducens]
MKTIDQSKPILVTGGTGYLASWIIKQLLDEGKEVRTTVRNLSQKDKSAHLTALAVKSKGTLTFFEADLLKKGSFTEAMAGCELVIHTASPFKISGLKNAQKELVEPALEGTRNVLESVNSTESVKRVVLTSSIVAIYGDAVDIQKTANGIFTEEDWNFSSSVDHQPYPYSKTLAEKLAWEMAGKQNRWDLLTINPGFIMGPSLSKRTDSTSIDIMIQLATGKFKTGVPSGEMGFIDVRDVAKAHILAGFSQTASGRHICVSEQKTFLDMANVIKASYPKYPLPKGFVPKWLFWLIAPLAGFTRKYVKLNVGIDLKFDSSYIRKDLGIEFIPFEKTITDHFEQILNDDIVKRK